MKHFIFLFVAFFMLNTMVMAGSAASNTQTQVALENIAPTTSTPTQKEKVAMEKLQTKVNKIVGTKDGGKTRLVAILLCFFLGVLGIHRFYMGDMWQGVVQLLSAGGLGIWALIDLIRLIAGGFPSKF